MTNCINFDICIFWNCAPFRLRAFTAQGNPCFTAQCNPCVTARVNPCFTAQSNPCFTAESNKCFTAQGNAHGPSPAVMVQPGPIPGPHAVPPLLRWYSQFPIRFSPLGLSPGLERAATNESHVVRAPLQRGEGESCRRHPATHDRNPSASQIRPPQVHVTRVVNPGRAPSPSRSRSSLPLFCIAGTPGVMKAVLGLHGHWGVAGSPGSWGTAGSPGHDRGLQGMTGVSRAWQGSPWYIAFL